MAGASVHSITHVSEWISVKDQFADRLYVWKPVFLMFIPGPTANVVDNINIYAHSKREFVLLFELSALVFNIVTGSVMSH